MVKRRQLEEHFSGAKLLVTLHLCLVKLVLKEQAKVVDKVVFSGVKLTNLIQLEELSQEVSLDKAIILKLVVVG